MRFMKFDKSEVLLIVAVTSTMAVAQNTYVTIAGLVILWFGMGLIHRWHVRQRLHARHFVRRVKH